jgi:hypothetical protein
MANNAEHHDADELQRHADDLAHDCGVSVGEVRGLVDSNHPILEWANLVSEHARYARMNRGPITPEVRRRLSKGVVAIESLICLADMIAEKEI